MDACVRFKVRHLTDMDLLRVDINRREVTEDRLSLIPHDGEGFLYAQCSLEEGTLCHGLNDIGFAFRQGNSPVSMDVVIQEVEIRVVPR